MLKNAKTTQLLKFIPLEFETHRRKLHRKRQAQLKFIPLEFETGAVSAVEFRE